MLYFSPGFRQSELLRIQAYRYGKDTPHFNNTCLTYDIEPEELRKKYKAITSISQNMKFRSFVCRLFAGMIYSNKQLHRFGIRDNPCCDWCEEDVQDLSHLFQNCPVIRAICEQLYIKDIFQPTTLEELWGTKKPPQNYILLRLNKYIYEIKQDQSKRKPSYEEYLSYLQYDK